MLDYFKVLGVKKETSKSKIKKAYRQLGFKWHPKMTKENQETATKRFQKLAEAYEVLTNDRYRKVFEEYYANRSSPENLSKFKALNLNTLFTFRDPEELFSETFNQGKNTIKKNDDTESDKIADEKIKTETTEQTKKKVQSKTADGLITRAVAIDCEMVGVGNKGTQSVLARVSLVNRFGDCIYDKYVKPTEPVTDYRTAVSGIRPQDIENGEDFTKVQKEVYEILNSKNRILVGHALKHDLKVLILDHAIPRSHIRDTAVYFKKMLKGKTPSLKRLTSTLLGAEIQCGEHDSVQDAKAAMMLYTMYSKKWESEIKRKRRPKKAKIDRKQTKVSSDC